MTRSLIESIADIKGVPEARAHHLQNVFHVYSIPFSRQMAIQIFGSVPAGFKFLEHNKFQYEKCVLAPETMADYISIVKAMGFTISPDFDGVFGRESAKTKVEEKFKRTIEMAVTLFWPKPQNL